MSDSIVVLRAAPPLRSAIVAALRALVGAQVEVAEFDDWHAAAKSIDSGRIKLVLCDRVGMSPDELASLARLRKPLVLFSADEDIELLVRGLKFVAESYALKLEKTQVLLDRLHERGRSQLPAAIDPIAPAAAIATPSESAMNAVPQSGITERQAEILQLLSCGYSNKEIARRLDIREGTVKVQMKNLFRVLGVRNRVELAILALRRRRASAEPAEGHPREIEGLDLLEEPRRI